MSMRSIKRLANARERSSRCSASSIRPELWLARFLSCSALSSVSFTAWTSMTECTVAKTVSLIKVATLSSTAVKKSSSLRRGWPTTKSMSFTRSPLLSILGLLRSDHRLRVQTSPLNFCKCSSRVRTRVWGNLWLASSDRASMSQFLFLKRVFHLLSSSEHWDVSQISKYYRKSVSIALMTLNSMKHWGLVLTKLTLSTQKRKLLTI